MIYPLKLFKTEEVKNLLEDFYRLNFQKTEVDSELGNEIVELTWESRSKDRKSSKYLEINNIFERAKKLAQPAKEVDPFNLLSWENSHSILDVGANKLRRLNKVSTEHPNFSRLIGIDIIPQAGKFVYPKKGEYYQVDEHAKSFPIENNSIDVVNIEFVFHHFPDEESIVRMVQNSRKALKAGGRLILWEETFANNVNSKQLAQKNLQIGIDTDASFTQRFYSLNPEQRWEFIIVNDWIINVANSHMPWTGQYRTWVEWKDLLSRNGFEEVNLLNLGLRVNGKIKQGVHVVGVFEPIVNTVYDNG